jgi:hypothetical protein
MTHGALDAAGEHTNPRRTTGERGTKPMKNLFTTADSAMLLIDHQVGTVKLAVSTPIR